MRQGPFRRISVVKEVESPENPGSLEKRVALLPDEVEALVEHGCEVFVEKGAGEKLGVADSEYSEAGAQLVDHEQAYSDKDLIIKFKGPALDSIPLMSPGTTLFCMAHFHSFPDRAKLLAQHQINVLAMEEILESPKILKDEVILSKVAMAQFIQSTGLPPESLHIGVIGYSNRMMGGIRRAGNRHSESLILYQEDVTPEEIEHVGPECIYLYDSHSFEGGSGVLDYLREKGCPLLDLAAFEDEKGPEVIKKYRDTHPPFEFGIRRIQCLHITGRAGAKYGYKLLLNESVKSVEQEEIVPVVLGYGNVGMGAIHECYDHGARKIYILGKRNTTPERIDDYLKRGDLFVNGAEQPRELRGKNFLITREQVKNDILAGSVVIDLVGGSATNRSPVENVVQCTFLTDPHFIEDDVYFASLWGWPMMGMVKESVEIYSQQILDVLIGREMVINGIDSLSKGVQRALVCKAEVAAGVT